MKRRNAFVRSLSSRSSNFIRHFSQIERFRNNTNLTTEIQDPQAAAVTAQANDHTFTASKPSPRGSTNQAKESKESVSESADVRYWEQTKLHFSALANRTQKEELEVLNLIKRRNISPQQTDFSNGKAPQDKVSARSTSPMSPKTLSTKRRSKSSCLETLKQFSFSSPRKRVIPEPGPSPSNDEDEDDSDGVEIQHEAEMYRHDDNAAPKAKDSRQLSQISSSGDSSDKENISSAVGNDDSDCDAPAITHPDEKEELSQSTKGEVVWGNFDTVQVIQQSRSARLSLAHRRNHLRRLSSNRHKSGDKGEYEEQQEGSEKKTVNLTKDDFLTMTVIGQFNLGFVLATGEDGQLWILDQHACDEIYNFEKLYRETKVHEQKLIAPLPLELSPSEENCVLENMAMFEKNGFRFSFDETKPPRHRLCLTALPHSGSGGDGKKAVQFGPEDVGALCAMLGADGACSSSGCIAGSGTGADGAGSMGNNAVRRHAGVGGAIIRLPKAVAMFASRACRSSIMIGEPLSYAKMEGILHKLRDVDQPWNCPHGRPTIRHVRDLLDQLLEDEKVSAERFTGAGLAVLSQDSQPYGSE